MEAWILVASEEATLGSVIAKQDLIFPSSRGVNHFSLCTSLPYFTSTYMWKYSKFIKELLLRDRKKYVYKKI